MGRLALYRPVPRQMVRKPRPSANLLRCGVPRPSRIPRPPPRRTGPRRAARPRPLSPPTAPRRAKPLPRRTRLPAGCRAGFPGSLAGDRARGPAARPPGSARHRRQPPRPPRGQGSPSLHGGHRSRRVRRSQQTRRPPVSQPRRSPPGKRRSQGPPAKRRSLSRPARRPGKSLRVKRESQSVTAGLPGRSPPPSQPDRTGRRALVRRTPSRSGARWCPRSCYQPNHLTRPGLRRP